MMCSWWLNKITCDDAAAVASTWNIAKARLSSAVISKPSHISGKAFRPDLPAIDASLNDRYT